MSVGILRKFMGRFTGEGHVEGIHSSILTSLPPRFKKALVIFFLLPGSLLATLRKLQTLGKTMTGVLASGTVLIKDLILQVTVRLLRLLLFMVGFRMSCSLTRGCINLSPLVGRTMMCLTFYLLY